MLTSATTRHTINPGAGAINHHGYTQIVGPANQTTNPFIQVQPAWQAYSPFNMPADVGIFDHVVNFFPVTRKGKNYLKHCTNNTSLSKQGIIDCLRKYTSDKTWFCTKVNVALASDTRKIYRFSKYIKELKYSIENSAMHFTGTVYRAQDMSKPEIHAIEKQHGPFFIPSFISTSKSNPFEVTDPHNGLMEFKNKNTLIHFDVSPKWSDYCMEIKPCHSKFSKEREILFTCYNIFKCVKIEKSNGKHYIKLAIMDREKHYDKKRNVIRKEDYPYKDIVPIYDHRSSYYRYPSHTYTYDDDYYYY